MQTVLTATPIERHERPALAIRLETAAYLALIALALVLRLADLGAVPISEGETGAALAAYRAVMPTASGESLTPGSPILFALQSAAFATLGGSELTARLLTALGGAILCLSPLLFRRSLGATRTFAFAVLLMLSPVQLVASRFSAPALWSMIFAVLLLWSLWRLREGERALWLKSLVLVSGGGLIFLSEPGGVVLALIALGAGVIALVWERRSRDFGFEDDAPPLTQADPAVRESGWSAPLIVGASFVILVSTGALLYPAGLNAIGEVFAGFVRGFSQAPFGSVQPFALYVSLFYEPFWWALGIVGIAVLFNRQAFTLLDRFFVAWLIAAFVASLVFVGATPYHALWFTVPLIGLTTAAVSAMLAPVRSTDVFAPPYWARWVIALAAVAVIAIFTLSAQGLARSLLTSASESLSTVTLDANSVILVIVSVMFMLIGFFLVASVWGNRAALQGVGLGVLIFGAITSLGSGWGAAVSDSDSPREPFHFFATSHDVGLLYDTLRELSKRNSGGLPAMPLTVMAPQDGVVAWIVRDFSHAEFTTDLGDAIGDPIVLLPAFEQPPVLGTSYVGQDFITRRTWSPVSIWAIDYPAWWMQRHARFAWMTLDTVVLWLRQDVYEGTFEELPAG